MPKLPADKLARKTFDHKPPHLGTKAETELWQAAHTGRSRAVEVPRRWLLQALMDLSYYRDQSDNT